MKLLLTGGTGSLCSALIKEQDVLRAHGISSIRVISRDEQKQVHLQRTYNGFLPLDCYLGDVTDLDRMKFALRDAHFVIHAAALKHVEKFESDVKVGYKTNIFGTQNVADAFSESKNAVSGIFVSTDKAADPITAYGVSKLAAEHLWLWNNTYQKQIKFGVARYGNILGSRGSVWETWTRLAKERKAMPITDPQCTRFFMTIQEAALFVLRILFENKSGIHIRRMKSADMMEVLKTIWHHWNPDCEPEILVTGMRSAEKVHEVLEMNGPSSFDAIRFTPDELRALYQNWLIENGFDRK